MTKTYKESQQLTKDVVAGMLKEDTGRHMLDSGGAYGRHWEQNQSKDFETMPYGTIHFSVHEQSGLWAAPDISLYHWLVNRLDYAEAFDAHFQKWVEENDRESCSYGEDIEDYLKACFPDHEVMYSDNTYNGEPVLSQDCQYHVVYVEVPEDVTEKTGIQTSEYVFLQVHGGCDIRGGYTKPRIFYTNT